MENLYQVVDSEDNIVGYKLRHEIDFKQDYYRVSALWLTNSIGQILIAQRLLTKDKDPGKWGPAAAGTLEQGETYESNAYKEALEEIGLEGADFVEGPKIKYEEPRKYFCQWYRGVSDLREDEFTPQPSEVERVQWVEKDALVQDAQANPEKYVPAFPSALQAYCG